MIINWTESLAPLSTEEKKKFKKKQHDSFRAFYDFTQINQEDDIIDFGCQKGEFLFYVAGNIKSALGIDISEDDINKAQKHTIAKAWTNLKFKWGNIGSMKLKEKNYSIAVSRYSIHNIYEYHQVISKMIQVISDSGRMALQDQISWENKTYDDFWDEFGKLLDVGHHQYVNRKFLVDIFYEHNLTIFNELQITQWISLRELLYLNPQAFKRINEIQILLKKNIEKKNFTPDLVKSNSKDLLFRIKYYLILGKAQ